MRTFDPPSPLDRCPQRLQPPVTRPSRPSRCGPSCRETRCAGHIRDRPRITERLWLVRTQGANLVLGVHFRGTHALFHFTFQRADYFVVAREVGQRLDSANASALVRCDGRGRLPPSDDISSNVRQANRVEPRVAACGQRLGRLSLQLWPRQQLDEGRERASARSPRPREGARGGPSSELTLHPSSSLDVSSTGHAPGSPLTPKQFHRKTCGKGRPLVLRRFHVQRVHEPQQRRRVVTRQQDQLVRAFRLHNGPPQPAAEALCIDGHRQRRPSRS